MTAALERIADCLERHASSVVASLPPAGLSKDDAAKFIGVDVATIEQLIRTRRLAYVQTGSQRGRLVPVESLREFLRQCRQEVLGSLGKNGRS